MRRIVVMKMRDVQGVDSRAEAMQLREGMVALRGWWGEAGFAAQMAGRRERHGLVTLAAVLRQIHEIIVGDTGNGDCTSETGGGGCSGGGCAEGCREAGGDGTVALSVVETSGCGGDSGGDSGGGGDTSGGGCCGGESLEKRVEVCHAVLDHLFAGEPTGRLDLDGFGMMVERFGLARPSFDLIVEGLREAVKTQRYATWKALRRSLDKAAGEAARLGFAILGSAVTEDRMDQIGAIGIAMALMDEVGRSAGRLRGGKLVWPVEDLLNVGLTERSYGELLGDDGRCQDERLGRLVQLQAGRARNLLHGGAKALRLIEDERGRRAAATLVGSYESKVKEMEAMGAGALRGRVKLTMGSRVRGMWRGLRLVARM